PWPHTDRPRRAAVSAFGVSGTNAHTILEQAPPTTTPEPHPHHAPDTEPHNLTIGLPLSAKTPNALRQQATKLAQHIEDHPQLPLPTIAHALATTRTLFKHRAVITARARHDALPALRALGKDEPHHNLVTGTATSHGKTVFVFPGQGSQYPGMAHDLYESCPPFTSAIDEIAAAFEPLLEHPLQDAMWGDRTDLLERTDYTQPVLFTVMTGLARLWQHHGIRPDAVIGHSQGEIAAAHIAGALSLTDAAKIVTLRARTLHTLTGTGGMAFLPLPHEHVQALLADYDDLHVAALNGPVNTVIAGNPAELHRLVAHLNDQDIKARTIPVNYASHTPHVHRLRAELHRLLADITPQPSSIAFYSTLTATPLDTTQLNADYWYRNLASPVLFEPTIHALGQDGHTTYIEPSPHPTLTSAVQDTLAPDTLTTGTLRKNHDDTHTLATALATLHAHGHPISRADLVHGSPAAPGAHTPLPSYPFQHTSHWLTLGTARRERNTLLHLEWEAISDVPGNARRPELPAHTLVLSPSPAVAAQLAPGAPCLPDFEALTSTLGDADLPTPDVILVPVASLAPYSDDTAALDPTGPAAVPAQVRETTHHVLGLLQRWLSSTRFAGCRLVLLTDRAIAVDETETPDLAQAPVWGLVRSAQAEHPDRFTLIDIDATTDQASAGQALTADAVALALTLVEPQLAIRDGKVRRPSFATTPLPKTQPTPMRDGTVLVTGGTGALGALTARHLVTHHGVTRLLLTSRRGPEAEGAEQLRTELTALGAHITLTACDAADHNALTHLINTIPTEHPLTAVIHTAGVLDLATLTNLTPEQLDSVMRPKVDAAWNLHRLTEGMDLDAFVLFSSIAGTLGAPGQANYAAANTFLDALAHHRHAQNLPATSLTWGPWAAETSMVRHLSAAALAGVSRDGFPPLATEDALGLLDAAMATGLPVLAPTRKARAALPSRGKEAEDGRDDSDNTAQSLSEQLAPLVEREQRERLLAVVGSATALVLAHPEPAGLDLGQTFKSLGFDSLTTVQLRNRLNTVTGLRLPSTLAFDHPTPASLVDFLRGQLVPDADDEPTSKAVLREIDKVSAALARLETDPVQDAEISLRLNDLLWQWSHRHGAALAPQAAESLETASDEELFEALDNELNAP
ncbi:SDR family NAD(P)-dependent oxidoreductase, partial [Streptomyces sp. NPDC055287]